MAYKLSAYSDYRQVFLLIISILFDLILFMFYWVDSSMDIYLILVIIVFQVYLNVINSFLYDISINEGKVFIKNLYKKESIIVGSEFDKIERVSFYYLLAMMFSPPFYVIKLKDGRKYIFLSNSYRAYFSLFTFGLYSNVDKLNQEVNGRLFSPLKGS
jgi:hypothetical protein